MSATPVQQPEPNPTPILDRLIPMPAPRGAFWMQVCIELAFTTLVLVLIFWRPPFITMFFHWAGMNIKLLMTDDGWTGLRIILTGFGMALACLGAILIHEIGHLVAGLVLGFHCKSFRFGRLKIDSGFKISLYQNPEDPALGWATMVPRIWQKGLRIRTAGMVVAGPLFSFASAYAIWHIRPNQSLISGVLVGWSLYLGLFSILPWSPYGSTPDGKRLLMLLFDRKRSERYFAMLKISDQIGRGGAEQQLDPEDLKRATDIRDESDETVRAHTIAFIASFSRQGEREIFQLLETALQYSGHASPAIREGLAVLAAYFQAFVRNRIDLAEQWLADTPTRSEFMAVRSEVEKAISKSKESAQIDGPAQQQGSAPASVALL